MTGGEGTAGTTPGRSSRLEWAGPTDTGRLATSSPRHLVSLRNGDVCPRFRGYSRQAEGTLLARLVILGAGIAGQTATLHARRKLGRDHEVVVVSPNGERSWVPSNIWVGVGVMTPEQVTFPPRPVYEKTGIAFVQGKAVSVHPAGDGDSGRPYLEVELTEPGKAGQEERVPSD